MTPRAAGPNGPTRSDDGADGTGLPLLFKEDRGGPGTGLAGRVLSRLLGFFRMGEEAAEPLPSRPGRPPRPTGRSGPPERPGGKLAEPEPAPTVERHAPAVHRSTLQILPGRLVPEAGLGIRQEIRFMRSSERHEVTLGSERGAPPDHVTVQHPSVEGRHGAMRFRQGHWWIRSLSGARPVVLNGTPLDPRDGPRHLKDGDVVRLGEVSFRFRMP